MTGDGVNDAPALKKADCGIAVSGATDAARAAASIVLTTPGLSVIIDAVKESRKIFQRMNSYAIYRIAETLRVMLFMTLAILVFNFYPLTAVMIVMLALLNDGAILSIAYDNVHYRDKPEAWNMRIVLGIAAVLGVIGPWPRSGCSTSATASTTSTAHHPDDDVPDAVGGRSPDDLPYPHPRPVLVDPAGAGAAGGGARHAGGGDADRGLRGLHDAARLGLGRFRLGLCAGWFLVNDRLKLVAYRIFDPVKTEVKTEAKTDAKTIPDAGKKAEPKLGAVTGSKSEATAQTTPDVKVETKTEAKTEARPAVEAKPAAREGEPKPEVRIKTKPETKAGTTSGLTSKIATRAYELYEQQGRQEGQSVQNWNKAEREVREGRASAEAKPETLAEPKPETAADPSSKPRPNLKPKPLTEHGDESTKTAPAVRYIPFVRVFTNLRQCAGEAYDLAGLGEKRTLNWIPLNRHGDY